MKKCGKHSCFQSRDKFSLLTIQLVSYIPVVYCLNKIDSISIEELDLLYRIPNAVPISSEHGWNIDELMEAMWDKLNLVRVYTKPKGKQPDYSQPVVLRSTRCTVEDFVSQISFMWRAPFWPSPAEPHVQNPN